MHSVELFAGCGGLAYGLAEAGFKHVLVVEKDAHASATLSRNQSRGVRHFVDWSVVPADVRTVDYSALKDEVDLVGGGPPCQPFSIGGKHKGPGDARNMWPEAIRAVQELRPRAFIFENVRGLLRPAFVVYLDFLRLQLSWPEVAGNGADWQTHHRRLLRHAASGATPTYNVVVRGINAADYGAPQKRHRAIVLGFRSDVAPDVMFPEPTHSREALVWSQRVSADYWDKHGIGRTSRAAISDSDRAILASLRERTEAPATRPWVTVRDAISDLPTPTKSIEKFPNHLLHPGARIYEKHTGSSWDAPAKALKAGDHGVPGGENVIVGRRGAVRYFTIRELARLQGLPDDFTLEHGWRNPIRQLGNAVPVQVGRAFGHSIAAALNAK